MTATALVGMFGAGTDARTALAGRLAGTRLDLARELPRGHPALAALPDWAGLVLGVSGGGNPAARELVFAAWALGLPPPVGWVDPDGAGGDADAAERDLREALAACGWPADDLPVLRGPGAADAVAAALEATVPADDRSAGPLRFPVEDVFTIRGRGVVAVGRVEQGTARVGDDVEIVGPAVPLRVTVVAMETFARPPLERVVPPDHCGMLLSAVTHSQVERGNVLATPGSLRPVTVFTATVYRPAGGDLFGMRVRAHGVEVAALSVGVVSPLDEYLPALPAGRPVTVRFESPTPLPLWPGVRLPLPEGGAAGVGCVVEAG